MAKHNETGKLGEEIAQRYLLKEQYNILELNWRWGKGEMDIIAKKEDLLIFIEVKTRTTNTFGHPEEGISEKKQNLMYELASEYMYTINYEKEFRFDVIAIVLEPGLEIKHFEDAFFPHW